MENELKFLCEGCIQTGFMLQALVIFEGFEPHFFCCKECWEDWIKRKKGV